MKYIFKQIDNISGSNAVTTIEFDTDYLPDVLEHFEMFIRGYGFIVSGKLDFVSEEEYYGEPEQETEEVPAHPWTQTLRDDAEWPFSKSSVEENWQGVAPSSAMQWTVEQLMKDKSVCPVCKIDNETMAQHECWDNNCPKGKDAD